MAAMVHDGLHSVFGDVNFDGRFNSGDLILMFQNGFYESQRRSDLTWAHGDFDNRFTTRDLVLALQDGGYEVDGARIQKAKKGPRVPFASTVDATFDQRKSLSFLIALD